MGEVAEYIKIAAKKTGKAAKEAVKTSTDIIGENSKAAIKDMAKQKTIIKAVNSGNEEDAVVAVGKSGVEMAAHIGAAVINTTIRSLVSVCKMLVSILGVYSLFIFIPAILIICCVGGTSTSKKAELDYSIVGGDYEYVSYKQTKYEAMFIDENGNTEDGWCGVTAYADALASVGCTNKYGEKITPYDVRTDEDCASQYVAVGGWCARFISKNFPDVNYEYTIGYTKDWIDEKLSEGMMVGIYLSSRAAWKENYTGKTKVTSSAHWILIVGKISNTEYACINPADGSGDESYVQAGNAEYGSAGTLTIDLSGLTSSSPSASSGDIRICSGDSAGTSDGKPRGTSYSPPAFAIGTDAGKNEEITED